MSWDDILLITSAALLLGASGAWLYQRLKKPSVPITTEPPAGPPVATLQTGVLWQSQRKRKGKHRVVDPGRGLNTRAARKAARRSAWSPNTPPRRAAHKALVLQGVADEAEDANA